MATCYASVGDVSDFLKVGIDETTTPNIAQVEKIIKRMEDRFDRRTGHAWRKKVTTKEYHDLPLIYSFGFGTMISLQHRSLQTLDACAGDKVEIWGGASGKYTCQLPTGLVEEIPERGEIYLRGYLFSTMRKNRVRTTYRWGGEPGDCYCSIPVPLDVEDAIMKMAIIDLVTSSFRFDILPRSDLGYELDNAVARWREDIDRVVRNREEMFVVTT